MLTGLFDCGAKCFSLIYRRVSRTMGFLLEKRHTLFEIYVRISRGTDIVGGFALRTVLYTLYCRIQFTVLRTSRRSRLKARNATLRVHLLCFHAGPQGETGPRGPPGVHFSNNYRPKLRCSIVCVRPRRWLHLKAGPFLIKICPVGPLPVGHSTFSTVH